MILWFALAWVSAVASQSTTDIHFIGWGIEPDVTSKFTAGAGWSTSGTVAGDCKPSGTCVLGTACTSGTLFRDDGSSMICTPQYQCVTWVIFETVPFGAPSATNWACRGTQVLSKVTLYRNLPSTPASITTADETTAPTTTTSSQAPNVTPPSPTSTGPLNAPSAAGDDAKSKAWIAGAVVGPIAGLGLCAVACWLWIRRRKRLNRGMKLKAHGQIADTQQVEQVEHQAGKTLVASPVMLHADSSRRASELPG